MVDARCRDLTNSAVCEKGRKEPGSVELCDWHEVCYMQNTGLGVATVMLSNRISESSNPVV